MSESGLTTFRKQLERHLEEQLGIPFVSGALDGPLEQDLGCTFPGSKTEVPGHVQDEDLVVRIRVFLAHPGQGVELPPDPAPLEELAEKLQLALKEKQTGLGPWYQRWISTEFDIEEGFGFESYVIARQQNLALG